jgi:peptidyl-prolyl cis-trans isomerase C
VGILGLALLLPHLLLLSGACRKRDDGAPAPPGSQSAPALSKSELDTPLATIDDLIITLGELEERINRQSPYVRARYTSLEQKKEFLDNLIRFEVLAKEAYRRGLDKDAEVVRTMKQVMIQKLINQEFDSKVTPDSISDAELRAYYDANQTEYVKREEVRASAVILGNRAQAERVLAEARGDAGKTNKGFRDLVEKYSSDEETKLRGGDLRYFTAESVEVPSPVVKAAFALAQIGDLSDVIDAGGGKFYVVKQTNRRKGSTRSFDDAKPSIRNALFREKRTAAQKAFIEGLRAKSKIEIDEASLAKVRIEPASSGGGAAAGPGEAQLPGLGGPPAPPGPPVGQGAPSEAPEAAP